MSLGALPNELLEQICKQIPPDSLERYGRTSRRIRSVAAPFIKEHRELKAMYKKVSLTRLDAVKMVYEMFERPRIRLYIRRLDLKANRHERPPKNFDQQKRRAKDAEAMQLKKSLTRQKDMKDLLRKTGLIPEDEMGKWLEEIERENEDYLFAFLLACLPNIEMLTIKLDRARLEQVKEMIRVIKRQPVSSHHPRALSRLTDARILEREGSDTCDLELFPLVASLPGVQTLHGRNLVGMYRECYRDGWMTYPGASPTITHISLETCGMSVEGLEKLCDSIKGLKSFKYVAHRAGWGLNRVSDLLRKAQLSLEELVLSTGSGDAQFVGSLRNFTALKYLTVDSDMLIYRGKMQRAIHILPPSIETAKVAGNCMTPPLEAEFLGDLYRPAFSYPHLRRLVVEDSWGEREIGNDRLQFQKEYHQQQSPSWMLRYR